MYQSLSKRCNIKFQFQRRFSNRSNITISSKLFSTATEFLGVVTDVNAQRYGSPGKCQHFRVRVGFVSH